MVPRRSNSRPTTENAIRTHCWHVSARGTAGGFFKTSHAVTSEARASSSTVQGACDGAAEKAEALDRLPAKRAPMLVLPSLSASRAQLWAC